MNETLIRAALDYHSHPRPGKIEIVSTKPVETREDLALAYTPGVGQASMAIARDPEQVARLTGRSNLVAVITDGTAVLGLGNIGPLAAKPIVFMLANPTPEIMPDIIHAQRPDALVATGRSDFPNQVNNALCFPFVFRAALDCGATAITEEMKLACVTALSDLARATPSAADHPGFGPLYLLPDVLDPRILPVVAAAVVVAAEKSGVATRPIADVDSYRRELLNDFPTVRLATKTSRAGLQAVA